MTNTPPSIQGEDEMGFTDIDGSSERDEREQLALKWLTDFRDMLDFLTDHLSLVPIYSAQRLFRYTSDPQEFARLGLMLGDAGTAEKSGDDSWYTVQRRFGDHILEVYVGRENVCQRRVVKTETVVESVPDPAYIALAPQIEVERVVEETEWLCPESLHSLAEER